MKKRILTMFLVLLSTFTASAVPVTETNPLGWMPDDVRPGGTVNLTTAYPKNGNGSIEINTLGTTAKAGYALYWDPTTSSNPFGTQTTLGNFQGLSLSTLRDSASTAPAHITGAIKLAWWNDYDNSNTFSAGDDTGYLIREYVYNEPGAVPTDVWLDENVTGDYFWERTIGKGTNEAFNITLTEWKNGFFNTDPNYTALSGNTRIFGVIADVGSGITGNFRGAVDNIGIAFDGACKSYNFEAVPEPSPILLFGMIGAIAFISRRRR